MKLSLLFGLTQYRRGHFKLIQLNEPFLPSSNFFCIRAKSSRLKFITKASKHKINPLKFASKLAILCVCCNHLRSQPCCTYKSSVTHACLQEKPGHFDPIRPDKNCPSMPDDTIRTQANYVIFFNQYCQRNVRAHTRQRLTFDTVYILQLCF